MGKKEPIVIEVIFNVGSKGWLLTHINDTFFFLVSCAGVRTHDLMIMGLLPKPLGPIIER